MQDIEAERRHAVERAQQRGERHVMAREVQQQAPPGQARRILDQQRRHVRAAVAGKELQEALEPVADPEAGGGVDLRARGRHPQAIRSSSPSRGVARIRFGMDLEDGRIRAAGASNPSKRR